MEALEGPKKVLINTFLYKKSRLKFGCVDIPYAILNILFALPMSLNISLMIYRIVVELIQGGGLKDISGSFYLALGTISAVCIYLSYALSSDTIIALLDLIENVVDYRKL